MTGELTPDVVIDNAAPSEDDAMGAVFDRLVTQNGADRGDGGKFVSPGAAEGAQQGDSPAGDVPPAGGDKGAADAQPSPVTGVAAPAHLPQALKAEWDKMPEVARSEIAKLTTEWDRKFGEIGKQYGAAKPIADKIMGAATQFPEFRGFSPEQIADGAVKLAAVQAAMERGPESAVSTIIEVAKTYNVLPQLAKLFQGQGQQQGNDNQQQVVQLQQQIANLQAQIARSANPETIRETVSMTMAERETETLVKSFAANEGKDYWADVEAEMPGYIRIVMGRGDGKSPKEIISEAYDMAINANPDVRAKVRASEAKATAANPDPKRTEAAKRAASINVPSNASGKERMPTEDELLAAAYDRRMAS